MKHYNTTTLPYSAPISSSIAENFQTFIEINQSAFNHNSAYYKKTIGHQNSLAVVIKGNGYGHGLEQMGYLCEQSPWVDWLCTASLSEALILRNNGITKPILVLGYTDISPQNAVHKNIAFMVDNLEYAQKFNDIGKTLYYQFPLHIKIDTGLSRLGIAPESTHFFIKQLQKLKFININGIFSHFIASDNNADLTQQQMDIFIESVKPLAHITPHIHMSNTMATTSLDYSSLFNFFRIGLGMYGFGNEHLQTILNWKTHIISLKTVPANSYVSYACTYKTTRLTKIALLPIGYSDGYQLRFSNTTSVLINNNCAPVIGRVGMNMTMIDVTDCPAKVGDIVTLIGNSWPTRVADLTHAADIPNPREFLTGIHPHIPRIII